MPGLFDLIALMAPNENIRSRASMLSSLGLGGGLTSSFGGGATPATGDSSYWEDQARQIATNQYGYSPQEWNMLDSIIERESHWNPDAVNPDGGAYGIPQILPRAHPNVNLQNDPLGQINWLLKYIQGRYGGVSNALQHKNQTGWY
jgi:hypothetical protein